MPGAGDTASDPGADATAGPGSGPYRRRMWAAATAHGIPLATILTATLIAFALLDLNVLVITLLWVLRRVILYCIIAGFIALLLAPAVRLMGRIGVPHSAATVVVFLLAILVVGGIIGLFTGPLIHAVTRFGNELPNLVKQAETGKGRIGHLLVRLHLQNWVKKNAPKISADIKNSLKPALALKAGTAAFSTLVAIGTIAVLSLFILLEMPNIGNGFLSLLSPARAERFRRVYSQASGAVSGYILGNGLTSLIAGIVMFIVLVVVGVPYPLLLGLWVALVDLLPLVGGLIAGVPVAVIALFHSLPAFVVVAIAFLAYQQIENHVLNPLIMSRTVRLNPLWVLLAVLISATLGDRVGSGLGAFAGALLGIPIGGAVQVVVREIRYGGTAEVVDGGRTGPGSFDPAVLP
jgi:predicted PurR-regulated permease PerM